MKQKIKQIVYKTLKNSEKITGTDNIYIAKGGFWLGMNNFFQIIAGFLISVIFANLLDPSTYGQYKYIISILNILSIFSLPAINTTLVQAVARGNEGNLEKSFQVKLKWSCLGSLFAIILGIYYHWQGNNFLSLPLFLSAIFLPLLQSSNIYITFLNSRKLFSQQAKYTLINRLFFIVGILLTLFLTQKIIWIVFAYLFFNTLINFCLYLWTKNKIPHNQKTDPQSISYGQHLSFISLIGNFASYLDKILIFHYLGSVPLAIFSFALSPIIQINGILNNLPILTVPKLAQRSIKDIKQTLFKRIAQTFLLGIVIAFFYFLLIPYFFYFFYPQYTSSIYYSKIMAILIVLSLPLFYLGSIVQSKITLYPKKWLYLSPLRSIILIILSIWLIKQFGLLGAIESRAIFLILGYIFFFIGWKLFLDKENR